MSPHDPLRLPRTCRDWFTGAAHLLHLLHTNHKKSRTVHLGPPNYAKLRPSAGPGGGQSWTLPACPVAWSMIFGRSVEPIKRKRHPRASRSNSHVTTTRVFETSLGVCLRLSCRLMTPRKTNAPVGPVSTISRVAFSSSDERDLEWHKPPHAK